MTPAKPEDRAEIETFLTDHFADSMFALSNLRNHGMAGGHPKAMQFWFDRHNGRVSGVLAISQDGMVSPVYPNADWGRIAAVLRARPVWRLIGAADQVLEVRRATGLTETAGLDVIEPHYDLSLARLQLPDVAGLSLHPLDSIPLHQAIAWRAYFCVESGLSARDKALARASAEIDTYIKQDTHRVLKQGDTPVAMTGFNAVLDHHVQIGGVFTPVPLRGQGFARAAVALHLAEVREDGVTDAVLSSANAAASRAYEAIGFIRRGDFAIVGYSPPRMIDG